jgi:DNA repair protein SbcC/Rad50
MIDTLELINWRTHKKTKLEFGKGTNVIIGVMGSGKSSIVNAISYTLFGNFPLLKSKQISLNEIIMNKPNEEEEAQTKITFKKNNKNYLIQRTIKKSGSNEAKLFENEQLIAGPKQKDVNEKIEKILGLNYELFSRAAYSEQNEMDFFLKLSPSERKKKFDELLELEKYETVRRNSLTLKNQFLKDNKQQKEFVEQQKDILKTYEEEKIIEKIKIEEEKIINLEKEKLGVGKILVEEKKELEEIEKKENKHTRLKEEITKEKSKIDTLIESLEKKSKINLEKTIKELIQIKIIFEKKTNEKEKLNNEINKNEEQEKKISEEIRILNYRLKEIENEEKEIKNIEGKCPKCKRELNEEQKKEIIEKGLLIINELNEKITNQSIKKNNFSNLIKEKKEFLKEIDKNLEEIKEKKFLLEKNKQAAEEKEKTKEEIQFLEKNIFEKEKEFESINFDKKHFEEKKVNYYEKKSKYNNIEDKLKNSAELKKNFENNIEQIQKIKNNIEKIEKKHTKLEEITKNLGIFENCLISTQNDLRETMLETINEAMTQIWSCLYPYKDFIDAKIKIAENGYDLQVQTRNGVWTRVDGILSGGERSAAAICIRVAFALVLAKQLSIFILDEPTHNLDKNAIGKLAEMLNNSMPELVEQIFVITHDKEMEKAATTSLYLLQRNKDIDEATKVEEMPIIN